MYTDPKWNQSYAQNVVGQLMEVVGVTGNEITLKSPLHIDYQDKFNPQIRPQRLISGVGIENLYIELKTDSDKASIYYKNAAYGWVKNIESYHTRKAHVQSESSIGCTVRDSKFSRSYDYGGGGHGYGVSLGYHTTDWLVENNIFDSLRHAMIFSKGANGNVFGYNYSKNVLQGTGETNLNDGWIPPDVSNHGHYSYMNLVEGNSVNEIGISDYWGPAGPGTTYFRNRVLSNETTDGISYYDVTTKQNVIGNSTIIIRDADGNAFGNLEHGNLIDGTLFWSDAINDHTLPNSYYLLEKPAFFDTKPWPLYGPQVGFSENLPAQDRFEGDTPTSVEKSVTSQNLSRTYPIFSIVNGVVQSSPQTALTLYSPSGRQVVKGKGSLALPTAWGVYILEISGINGNTSLRLVIR